jgi:mono/diheme cytochrome c family protein
MFSNHILGINLEEYNYGLNVYKKGNCMGCHSWHGKGGGGYGAGVSLRNMDLTLNEIINVIKCGRPGTGMPYFLRKAYKEEKCYDTTLKDYNDSYRPVNSKRFLSPRQIEAVSIFVKEVLHNKKLDKNYCEFFYQKGSKVCQNLEN